MPGKSRLVTECRVKTRTRNGKTTYAYCFEGVKIAGKRNQIEKGGFHSFEDAKKAGDEALFEYYRGSSAQPDLSPGNLITVQDFINNVWFESRAKQKNWLPATKAGYRRRIETYIMPAIGRYPVSSITVGMLQDIVDNAYDEKKISYSSASNLHSLLHCIFSYARDHEYIRDLHLDEFPMPKRDFDIANPYASADDGHVTQKRDIIPTSKIDAIFRRFPEGTPPFLIMAICLYTGARRGEASALAVEDCDFEKNLIHIRRQFPDGATDYVTNPKYDSGRTVPMCPALKAILLRAIEKNRENEEAWGFNYQHTYLVKRPDSADFRNVHGIYDINYESGIEIHFINLKEYGKVIGPEVMKHASRIIHGYGADHNKKQASKPIYAGYNTHSFRHTFASFLDEQGVSDTVKSAVLGHKRKAGNGASSTTNRYIHVTDEQLEDLCDIAEKIYTFRENK